MAWALLSPLPPSLTAYAAKMKNTNYRRRATTIILNTTNSEGGKNKGKDDAPAFNPFGFVTDNPSSRSAIQLPESPAEDGNVGQMLYRIEDKGKEYGSYVKSGKFTWFVRETGRTYLRGNINQFILLVNIDVLCLTSTFFLGDAGSPESQKGTIVFLHGAPTQSYSYRVVMSQVGLPGFRFCFLFFSLGFNFECYDLIF